MLFSRFTPAGRNIVSYVSRAIRIDEDRGGFKQAVIPRDGLCCDVRKYHRNCYQIIPCRREALYFISFFLFSSRSQVSSGQPDIPLPCVPNVRFINLHGRGCCRSRPPAARRKSVIDKVYRMAGRVRGVEPEGNGKPRFSLVVSEEEYARRKVECPVRVNSFALSLSRTWQREIDRYEG